VSAQPLEVEQQRFLAQVLRADAPEDPRMAVYHRTALAARSGALAAAYPVVERLVGGAFFGEAARVHACATPSASGDLHDYGAGFADFLAGYGPAAALTYLPDVARLEWAVHESRHAAGDDRPDFAALGRVAPHELVHVRMRLHPSVRLVASGHPILSIWEANQAGRDGVPEEVGRAQRVVVRRIDNDVRPIEADAASWLLLGVFSRGGTLGEGVEALGPGHGEIDAALARLAALEVLGGFTAGAPA
jgi:hypothetical protein